MTVRTYHPDFKVFITKNVQRQDAPAAADAGIFDLTPYLGDGSTLSIAKSLYQPCGSALITIPDQMFEETWGGYRPDSLYGLVEPTDGIEIYLARNPEEYGWGQSIVGKCPTLMRGFVRQVYRTERMGQDGKPYRQTVIQAQDYGAVFDMLRVWNLHTAALGVPNIFDAYLKYGDEYVAPPTAVFMGKLVEAANRWLDEVYARGGWTWRIVTDFTVSEGVHVMQGINGQEGPYWSLIARECDSPWNEIFFDERESGPTLVYRPTPWRQYTPSGTSLSWQYLPQGGQTIAAETIEAPVEDIVALDAGRSDDEVQNIFWLECPTATQSLHIAEIMAAAVAGQYRERIFDTEYENNDPTVYGHRMLQAAFRQWPNSTQGNPIGCLKDPWHQNQKNFEEWWLQRIDWLRLANRDNGILEHGTLTVKGDERIRIGKYVRIVRGHFEWEAYIAGVTHDFAPFREYTTTIEFTRGTGFWNRLLTPYPPYLLEGHRGVYS